MADFFDEDARRYDQTVAFTQEDYGIAHEALTYVSHQLLGDSIDAVLNLGSGTAEEALRLMKATHVRVLQMVDGSAKMIALAKTRVSQAPASDGRITEIRIAQADLRQIQTGEYPWLQPRTYDLITTAYSLHHLSADEKVSLYSLLKKSLKPGGYFLNLDLFKLGTDALQSIAKRRTLAWIQKHRPENDWSEEDVDRWSAHVQIDNIPLVCDLTNTANEKAESLLLQNAGFTMISCPYRFFESGLVVAR